MPEEWITINSGTTANYIISNQDFGGTSSNWQFSISTTASTDTMSNHFLVDGRWLTVNDEFHADYIREMQFNGVPTVLEWRAALDPVECKILDERAWIGQMARRARERAEVAAEAKAQALVAELFEMVEGSTFLTVESSLHLGRVYRVPLKDRSGYLGTVRVEEGGKLIHRLCAHPPMDHPAGDHAIAKALWLEANEAEFLRVANVHQT